MITSPNDLNRGVEVVINSSNLTIELVETGNLTSSGVTFLALFQFLESQWTSDPLLFPVSFPLNYITDEKYEMINGWTFIGNSINLLKSGGFALKNVSGDIIQEYCCIITFGNIGEDHQVYYSHDNNQTIVNFNSTGQVNQLVEITESINNIKLYVREYYNEYDMSSLSDIGISNITYQVYRFPLNNSFDLNIDYSSETADLYGVTITFNDVDVQKDINGNLYPFKTIIDGNGRTVREIYEAVQSLLTKEYDIDYGTNTVIGKVAPELLYYEGEILTTKPGVFVENFNEDDINEIEFYDSNNVLRTYKYVATGTFIFNEHLFTDVNAEYMMFYTDNWGTENAVQVMNADGNPITGTIGQSEIVFTYNYDTDTNGGPAASDKNVTLIAIGKDNGQFVKVNGTITRTKLNIFRMNAVKELSYKI